MARKLTAASVAAFCFFLLSPAFGQEEETPPEGPATEEGTEIREGLPEPEPDDPPATRASRPAAADRPLMRLRDAQGIRAAAREEAEEVYAEKSAKDRLRRARTPRATRPRRPVVPAPTRCPYEAKSEKSRRIQWLAMTRVKNLAQLGLALGIAALATAIVATLVAALTVCRRRRAQADCLASGAPPEPPAGPAPAPPVGVAAFAVAPATYSLI